ncbi:MAG TPA: malate dehydrogenase [Candidatus Avamphibacillus intestinigallinarum]|nr:malate dehydrogenase [Candidatus Avamphibacillus intestinigallinarum]
MSFERKKIAVIGSGATGATTAFMLVQKELGDVVLLDIPEMKSPTMGRALDMSQAGSISKKDVHILGSANYDDLTGADVVIVTAGVSRRPGMSRDELLDTNATIMKSIAQHIKTYAPDSIVIVLSNPVDIMSYLLYKETGFPKSRVIGQSGVLDTGRLCTFIAEALDVSVKDVQGFVLGGHGDQMVPLIRYTTVGGIPLEEFMTIEQMDEIVDRTRKGGGEIVELLGNGSAYYAPAAALTIMLEAILKDQRRILPTIAYLEGEYGHEDVYLGVPTIISGKGLEKIIELDLTNEEQEALDLSTESVQRILNKL